MMRATMALAALTRRGAGRRAALVLLAAALPLLGCSGKSGGGDASRSGTETPAAGAGAASAAPAAEDGLAGLLGPALAGWMGRMGQRPAEVSALTNSSEGWNSLWAGELDRSIEAFAESAAAQDDPQVAWHRVGLARSRIELGDYHQTLFRATLSLVRQYVREREARRQKIGPITPLERLYEPMAALLAGEPAAAAATSFAALAEDASAARFAALARAWLGLALWLDGKTPEAEAAWTAAAAAADAPNNPLLVAYLKARVGQPLPAELPAGDGSPYARRLRVAALARGGQGDQALRELASLNFREPDHSVSLQAAPVDGEAPAGDGNEALAERTQLDFYGPYFFEELARLRYGRAAAGLGAEPGPGGCWAYWRGRAAEALGDTEATLAAYAAVKGGGAEPIVAAAGAAAPAAGAAAPAAGAAAPAAEAQPAPDPAADPLPCLVLSPFATVDELAADAALRSAGLRGQPLPAAPAGEESWVLRLSRTRLEAAAGRGDAAALVQSLAFLPEDARVLETALEKAFESKASEKGLTALLRARFFEQHLHQLYEAKAQIATRLGETRLAVKVLDSLHDNSKADDFSTLNRPGYLLSSALARWQNNDPQGAAVLLNVLWKRYPEVWPASEFVRRIRAVHALENITSNAPISGQ